MDLEFSGEIIHWRGPAPFHFVETPEEPSAAIEAVSSLVTYGWGAIPAVVRIGATEFRTSLFPKGRVLLRAGQGRRPQGRTPRPGRHRHRATAPRCLTWDV